MNRTIYVQSVIWDRLKAYAEIKDASLSTIIQLAIVDYLDKKEKTVEPWTIEV